MRRMLPCVLLIAACNVAPEGLQVSLSPEAPSSLDDIVVVIDNEAVDSNGDDVSYYYTWTLDGARTDFTEDHIASGETRKGQLWSVQVSPTDGKTPGTTATAEVTVANTVPTVEVSIAPESPLTTDRLEVRVQANDIDRDAVELAYSWKLNGSPLTIRGPEVQATRTTKGEVWEVSVVASDDEGEAEAVTLSVTIGNTPPSIDAAVIEPQIANRSTVVSCVGKGWTDADGDNPGAQLEWQVDGVSVGTEAELSLAPYARGSKVVCIHTPFDGDDAGAERWSSPIEIRNTPPSIGSLTISPETPLKADELKPVLTDAVDLDEDSIRYEYIWRINGAERSTVEVLDGKYFVHNDKIVLQVTPFDGLEYGDAVLSNQVTAGNNPPSISSLTVAPDPPRTNDMIEATAVANDPDGGSVTISYAWYVDSKKVAATGSSLDGASWFDKHQDVYVVATPNDGTAGPPVTSDTLDVLNTVPPAPKLVMDPADPTDKDDVTCTIDSQPPDADADKIAYTFAWTRDGVAFTGATKKTWAGDTVPASSRKVDEIWRCSVTPNDGDDDGPIATRTLGVVPPIGVEGTGSLAMTPLRGGSMAGTTYNEDCDTDEFVVGIEADLTKTGGYHAALAGRCAPLTLSCEGETCTVKTGTITTGTKRGGTGTVTVKGDCPAGYVVTGFAGRAGWYLDQIALRCAPVELDYDGDAWSVSLGTTKDIAAVGGTGGGVLARADCKSGQVATRHVVRAQTGQVDGFGLGCKALKLIEE